MSREALQQDLRQEMDFLQQLIAKGHQPALIQAAVDAAMGALAELG